MNIPLVAQNGLCLMIKEDFSEPNIRITNHMVLYIILTNLKRKNRHWRNKGQRERAVLILNSLNTRTNKIYLLLRTS